MLHDTSHPLTAVSYTFAVPSLPSAFLCFPYTSTETPTELLSADWEYSNGRGSPFPEHLKHTQVFSHPPAKVFSYPSVPAPIATPAFSGTAAT